jgi:uncharacterized membrane protein
LPAELLFSPAEISVLNAQYEKSKQERDARIEKEKRRKSRDGCSYGGEVSWGGSADGGDGGGGGGGD